MNTNTMELNLNKMELAGAADPDRNQSVSLKQEKRYGSIKRRTKTESLTEAGVLYILKLTGEKAQ